MKKMVTLKTSPYQLLVVRKRYEKIMRISIINYVKAFLSTQIRALIGRIDSQIKII